MTTRASRAAEVYIHDSCIWSMLTTMKDGALIPMIVLLIKQSFIAGTKWRWRDE